MSDYTPPLRDIRFVMDHVADLDAICATERFDHVDAALSVLGRDCAAADTPGARVELRRGKLVLIEQAQPLKCDN